MNNPKHIDPRLDPTRTIRAPRGAEKTCKTWIAEAAYRMIQNNLDPEVADIRMHWSCTAALAVPRVTGIASIRS